MSKIKLESKLGVREFSKEQADKLLAFDSGWTKPKAKKDAAKSGGNKKNSKLANASEQGGSKSSE